MNASRTSPLEVHELAWEDEWSDVAAAEGQPEQNRQTTPEFLAVFMVGMVLVLSLLCLMGYLLLTLRPSFLPESLGATPYAGR